MKKIVWRTDSRVFELSETICSGGDHLETLSAAHEGAEEALRNAMGDRGRLRSTSLYTWEDEEWARRAWALENKAIQSKGNKKYLYRLEIDDSDIFHRGDVNHYTDIGDALRQSMDPSKSIQGYLNGNGPDRDRHSTARFEILVRKALVLEKLCPK
ncbi:hypothetical protein WAF00_15600 [Mameliella alba]|uniref:hypothetical protein n=1 Tax=Mameliella alba TaxID=561184 RepID=UPI003012B2BF